MEVIHSIGFWILKLILKGQCNNFLKIFIIRHYHSMEVFANYDILDSHGNKVANGHKASFCLEDVECIPGASKRYECVGYSDQGKYSKQKKTGDLMKSNYTVL